MALRSLVDVAFRRVWLSMKSSAVSVSGHSFNFSFPAHNHSSPCGVIMIVVRLYQRDKYYQSDRLYKYDKSIIPSPLRGLVPEVETANKRHNFQRMETCVMGQLGRKLRVNFKG